MGLAYLLVRGWLGLAIVKRSDSRIRTSFHNEDDMQVALDKQERWDGSTLSLRDILEYKYCRRGEQLIIVPRPPSALPSGIFIIDATYAAIVNTSKKSFSAMIATDLLAAIIQ